MTLFLIGFVCGVVATIAGLIAFIWWMLGRSNPPPFATFGDQR